MTRDGFHSPATADFCEMANAIRALASDRSPPPESAPSPADIDV